MRSSDPPPPGKNTARPGWLRSALPFVLPALFFILAWSLPERKLFEISTDEGINLMKAALVHEGFPLYSEVWSDQPPLFTHMLAAAFNPVGYRVESLRLVIAGLSSLLLFAVFKFLELESDEYRAALGIALLFLLPTYLILSISIMVGLPSIVFAVLAMTALAYWHRKNKLYLLLLSAVFLGLAIMIKLITGFIAPILFIGLVVSGVLEPDRDKSLRRRLLPAAIWLGVFTACILLTALGLVGIENLSQLVTNHLQASGSDFFNATGEFRLATHIGPSYPFIFLGLIGGALAIRNRRWVLLYPLAWMLTAWLLLAFYSPVWYHHLLLITVPAAILGAETLHAGLRMLGGLARRIVDAWQPTDAIRIAALIVLVWMFSGPRTPDPFKYFFPAPEEADAAAQTEMQRQDMLACISAYAAETQWLFTDRPMYGFRTDLLVPPDFAVLSLKRMRTGEVTENDLITGLERYQPEQVLLSRFELPLLEQRISADYILVDYIPVMEDSGERLFIHKTIFGETPDPACRP